MELKLGETVYFDFTTHNTTGEVADASVVGCEVFEDANDTPILSPTPVKRTGKTGNYRVQIDGTTENGFEADKTYNAIASATTDKAGKGCIGTFKVRANHIGELAKEATNQAEHDATQAAIAEIPVNPVNIMSATKGAIQVSYAKTGGTVEVVQGDTISIPYGPLGKDITGRKVYFGVKQFLSDTVYAIAVKEITAQITDVATFTGTIPLTSAELNLTAGNYYAEIESRGSDGITLPATELKFILKVVNQVIV